nr:transcription termination/antitermination NusG family protein [uncultured Bradyrhizobium sp.]
MFDPLTCKIGDFVGLVPRATEQRIELAGELHWHIVAARPRRVKLAVEQMTKAGLKPYLPTKHRVIPAGRRRKREVDDPMFGDRIFVQLPRTYTAFFGVLALRDVEDFVMIDDWHPALLKQSVIDIIRAVEAEQNAKYTRQLAKKGEGPFKRGRQVWADVMMRRLLGVIDSIDKLGRVEVRLEEEIFGRRIWPLEPHLVQFVEI